MDRRRILIIALARSGYHAITHWMCSQLPGGCVFLNNCNQELRGRSRRVYGDGIHEVYSFENFDLRGLDRDIDVGQFSDIIIVLRDPFNWIASSLRQGKKNAILDKPFTVNGARRDHAGKEMHYARWFCASMSRMDMFRQYASAVGGAGGGRDVFMVRQTAERHARIITPQFVSFNRWFSSVLYREKIAANLKLEFTDAGLNTVASSGGGSSFQRHSYDGKAQGMDVLDRWMKYVDDPRYRELISQDIVDWSRRLFSFVPLAFCGGHPHVRTTK